MRAAQLQSLTRAVFVVRHGNEVPELYTGDCLVYPRVHSGSLALAFDKLGLRQVDHETGDFGGIDS
jgi:phage head maturation protease